MQILQTSFIGLMIDTMGGTIMAKKRGIGSLAHAPRWTVDAQWRETHGA